MPGGSNNGRPDIRKSEPRRPGRNPPRGMGQVRHYRQDIVHAAASRPPSFSSAAECRLLLERQDFLADTGWRQTATLAVARKPPLSSLYRPETGQQLLWAQTADPLTQEKFDATRMNN